MSWDNSTQAGFSLKGVGLTGYGTAGYQQTADSRLLTADRCFPAVQGLVRPARNG